MIVIQSALQKLLHMGYRKNETENRHMDIKVLLKWNKLVVQLGLLGLS